MKQLCLSLSVSETSARGHAHIPPEVMKEPQGRGWGNVWARMVWMLLGATATLRPRMEELVVHLGGGRQAGEQSPQPLHKEQGEPLPPWGRPRLKGSWGYSFYSIRNFKWALLPLLPISMFLLNPFILSIMSTKMTGKISNKSGQTDLPQSL